jgi:hypothetical protein
MNIIVDVTLNNTNQSTTTKIALITLENTEGAIKYVPKKKKTKAKTQIPSFMHLRYMYCLNNKP